MASSVAQVYARLKALRGNLPEKRPIDERLVREMHDILDQLSALGLDIEPFRIPDSDLTRRLRSENSLTGESTYSRERYVAGELFKAKLDALLLLFQIESQGKKIGFAPPE